MAAVGAFTSMDQAEDLKAFERRLVEYISVIGPSSNKWRVVLLITCVVTAWMAWIWALDQRTSQVSFLYSLYNHKLFTMSLTTLITLFLFGAHKRIMVQSIILSRSKQVLQDFNMSCDERGRIILKPRPVQQMDSYHRLYNGHG